MNAFLRFNRGMMNWVISAVVIMAAMGLAVLVFLLQPEKPTEVETVPALLSVHTERVQPTPVPTMTEISGFLSPRRTVILMMEETGRVDAKPFEAGTRVASGELIVGLETDMIGAEVAQAEANLSRAQHSLDLAREQFERAQALLERSATSQDEVDIKEAAYTVALADVESARAALDLNRVRFERFHLSAPFPGVVSMLDVEIGSQVMTGEMIGRLDDVRTLEVHLMVAPEVREALHLGGTVEVWPDRRPHEIHEGIITRLDEVADTSTRKFQIEITLDNPNGELLAGSPVRCRLVVSEPREALIIPQEWTTHLYATRFVFLVDHGASEETHVNLTQIDSRPVRERPGMLEVTAGLEPNAEIVIERLTDLADGQQIDPILTAPSVAGGA